MKSKIKKEFLLKWFSKYFSRAKSESILDLPPLSEENEELWKRIDEEASIRERSNSELLDKSILSLSSAFLGVTITFNNQLVSFTSASNIYLLSWGWILLGVTIIIVLSSFYISNIGMRKTLEFTYEYYTTLDKKLFNKKSKCTKAAEWLTPISLLTFITGTALILSFIIINITGEHNMSNNESSKSSTPTEIKSDIITESLNLQMSIPAKAPARKQETSKSDSQTNKSEKK